MNQKTYLEFLSAKTGIDVPSGMEDLEVEELFHGLFQRYRPDGSGVRELLQPLEEGEPLAARMDRVFKVDAAHGDGSHFFVPKPLSPDPDASLETLGRSFVENLRTMLDAAQFPEAHEMLGAISNVEFLPDEEIFESDSEEYEILFEALTEWEIEHDDPEHPLSLLEEAYYSVNMDPWLVLWMKWPVIGKGISLDVFEPYFQMWCLGGYTCRPAGTTLLIGR